MKQVPCLGWLVKKTGFKRGIAQVENNTKSKRANENDTSSKQRTTTRSYSYSQRVASVIDPASDITSTTTSASLCQTATLR